MQWWYGIIANSIFFSSLWALTAKYLTARHQFLVQLILLPIVYLVNVWFGRSSILAYDNSVPYPMVMLLSVGATTILSFLLGIFLLKQNYSVFQIAGMILVVGGLVLLKR